jgi:hypothetical protein
MTISFADRVTMPEDVLVSGLENESVILNLQSETYYGLDEVGTRFLTVLTASESIQAAYEKLLDEYEVDAAALRKDLLGIVEQLSEQGIVRVEPAG